MLRHVDGSVQATPAHLTSPGGLLPQHTGASALPRTPGMGGVTGVTGGALMGSLAPALRSRLRQAQALGACHMLESQLAAAALKLQALVSGARRDQAQLQGRRNEALRERRLWEGLQAQGTAAHLRDAASGQAAAAGVAAVLQQWEERCEAAR